MSKPIYKPTKPYTEDINDLVEKGGVGSGIRGHKTQGPQTMNRKTGKLMPTEEYQDMVAKELMNYSGFSDVGGSFMSIKQVISAVSKITGHSDNIASTIVKDLEREGRIELMGKVYMVMQKKDKESMKMIDELVELNSRANDHEEDWDADKFRSQLKRMSPKKLKAEYDNTMDYLNHKPSKKKS